MRNIFQQPRLRFHQPFDPVRHAVEIAHQLRQFVASGQLTGAPVRALKSPAARLCAAFRKRVTGLVIDHASR